MFSTRSEEKEMMDDLDASGEVIATTLQELDVINRRLGGNFVTINGLEKLLRRREIPERLKIADLGCGGGDILVALAKWSQRKNIPADLTGVDANPHVIAYAKENTRPYPQIALQTLDIFSREFREQEFDVITCSLFTHHFSQGALIRLIKQLKEQAGTGIVINDLHRHWLAYYSIKVIVKLFSRSAMVKNDGPVSVLRGFSRQELEAIMQAAGIREYTISWHWAFRWQLVIWNRPFRSIGSNATV